MADQYDKVFDHLLNAYPEVIATDKMRETYLVVWRNLPLPVVKRTVDRFIEKWARCPSLDEFEIEADIEAQRQSVALRRERMDQCTRCDAGWVLVNDDAVRPCSNCLPDTYENWATGKYLTS